MIVGIEAFRRGGESPNRRAAFIAAAGVVIVVALWAILNAFPPHSFYGPEGDFLFVLPGGILAAAGSLKLREPGQSRRGGPSRP